MRPRHPRVLGTRGRDAGQPGDGRALRACAIGRRHGRGRGTGWWCGWSIGRSSA